MDEFKRPYSPETLAKRWQCSGAHVRAMIRRGELQAFRLGKLLRIPAAEVERWESGEILTEGAGGRKGGVVG